MTTTLNKKLYLLSLIILAFVVLQAISGLHFNSILKLQTNQIYKQVSGYLLLLCICLQWYLGLSRHRTKTNRRKIVWHKSIGLLLPLLFYFHAMQYGYAYQTLIWVVFILNCVTACLGPDAVNYKGKTWRLGWFILHIAFSSLLTVLLFYHLFVVYNYS